LCNKGLNQISKFHYSNDIWFKRRIALCYFKLKEYELSLSILQDVLKKKKEWFVEKEIAEVYIAMGDMPKATQFAIDAALSPGDYDKKVNLYNLIAEILILIPKKEEALDHYILIYAIKKEFEQRITSTLENRIKELGGDTTTLPQSRQQFNKCKNIWSSLKFGDQKELKGKIDKMLPNGKSGFVKSDIDGQSYFFGTQQFKGKRELIKQGQEVKFFLEDSFDKSKNKPSKIAINIMPIFARNQR
jgi:tetratricopeptide (TPR) repeat protein